MLRRLGTFAWREPLAHFVLGGGLIFLAYYCLPHAAGDAIVITPAAAEAAFKVRAETIGRPLTGPERSIALAEVVEEELLVREALRLGVDRQDVVIRSRLADKMRFLLSGEPPTPSQQQLRAYLQANRQRFSTLAVSRQAPTSAAFEDLEPMLKRQWVADQREQNLKRGLEEIRRQYTVRLPAGMLDDGSPAIRQEGARDVSGGKVSSRDEKS
jgi:hypothetical protein